MDELRRVRLSGGRDLVVRPVTAGDVDALEQFYAGLSSDDRHRRFFSVYRPNRAFFERITTATDRGGFGLVAVVQSEDGIEELAGEAGYALLPNGDGELAITVGERWRGWLGPYLLDALLTVAGERGVPNLEAEVLVTNGPMLAMARARDCVTVQTDDLSAVRVLIGTGSSAASWPGPHDRVRVLLEGSRGAWRREAVRAAGVEVLACPGPAVRHQPCPALEGRPCPLVADADVVVMSHVDQMPQAADLARAHRHLHTGVPICLDTTAVESAAIGVPAIPRATDHEVVAFVQRLATGKR